MITPSSFVRDLSKSRNSRQELKLAMDQVRAMPPPAQRMDPLQAPRPSAAAARMPSSQTVPSAMSSSGGRNGAGGVGGPRPVPTSRGYSSGPASPTHTAHGPGHGVYPGSGSGHQKSSSKDSKEGDKKDKKKKKLGIF